MELNAQKKAIIEQVKQTDDIDVINAISSILDWAKTMKATDTGISPEDQAMVLARLKQAQNKPEELLDWEKAKSVIHGND